MLLIATHNGPQPHALCVLQEDTNLKPRAKHSSLGMLQESVSAETILCHGEYIVSVESCCKSLNLPLYPYLGPIEGGGGQGFNHK